VRGARQGRPLSAVSTRTRLGCRLGRRRCRSDRCRRWRRNSTPVRYRRRARSSGQRPLHCRPACPRCRSRRRRARRSHSRARRTRRRSRRHRRRPRPGRPHCCSGSRRPFLYRCCCPHILIPPLPPSRRKRTTSGEQTKLGSSFPLVDLQLCSADDQTGELVGARNGLRHAMAILGRSVQKWTAGSPAPGEGGRGRRLLAQAHLAGESFVQASRSVGREYTAELLAEM
jgi:hypothetical protein